MDVGGATVGGLPPAARALAAGFDEVERALLLVQQRADAFVALPGGVGTLEELVEQLTWVQLGRHRKPVLIADVGGFWRPLLSLFAHMRDSGFIRRDTEVHYLVSEKIEDIVPMLRKAAEFVARDGAAAQQLDNRL